MFGGDCCQVMDMGERRACHPCRERVAECRENSLADEFLERFRHPLLRNRAKAFAIIDHQPAERGLAQRVRLLQYRLEHRSEIAGRRVDGLQDFGDRGLPGQRLVTLGPGLIALGRAGGKFPQKIGHRLVGIG